MGSKALGVSTAAVIAILLVAAALFAIAGEQRYSNCIAKIDVIYGSPASAGDSLRAEVLGQRDEVQRALNRCSRSPI